MKLNEINTAPTTTPVFISVTGSWPDDDYGMLYGDAIYVVDVPSADVGKVIKFAEDLDDAGDTTDLIDTFEQDGWEPNGAAGHADSIQIVGASTEKPKVKAKTLKNYYTMVYFLRDNGLLSDDYAKSIAKTEA